MTAGNSRIATQRVRGREREVKERESKDEKEKQRRTNRNDQQSPSKEPYPLMEYLTSHFFVLWCEGGP